MKGITMELRRINSVYYELTNITPLQFKVICLLANNYTAMQICEETGAPLQYVDYVAQRLFKYYRSTRFKD